VTRWVFGILVASIGSVGVALADATDDTSALTYHASVGPAIYVAPAFPGARETRQVWFPFVDADIGDRFYTSAADLLGIYAYKTEATQVGAAVEWDLTHRISSDDDRLRGLPNVGETARFKLFASRTVSFVTGDVNVAMDVAGRGQGTLAQANLWLTVPFDPTFSVSLGPGATWADTDYMHTFYSVTAAEGGSPLPMFASRAGVVDVHLNGLAEWVIFSHYRIGASAYLADLKGAAASSPITERRGQSTLVGWIAYRFK
jgi:outer membrane scaffolding protein for murein synthesis (MipA/OmpV family)